MFYFCSLACMVKLLIPFCIGILLLSVIGIPLLFIISKRYFKKRRVLSAEKGVLRVGIFHPYCNAGGGGEKVLWVAVKAMQKRYPGVKIAIYTGDLEASPDEIINRARQRLNITVAGTVEFVYLRRRKWVEAAMYPCFTLIGQSLGSIVLGIEALVAYVPDLYLDTMGYAFTMPLFKYVGGCSVACYTHYPTITTEMLTQVASRIPSHNNRRRVARSPFLTAGKLVYYHMFAWVYGMVGRCADIVMVNSSWTEEHINSLWQVPLKTHRVYPPCDVDDLKGIPRDDGGQKDSLQKDGGDTATREVLTAEDGKELQERDEKSRQLKMVFVGQFRPEKNHPLLLRSMYELRQIIPDFVWDRVMLVIIGSCRNSQDDELVRDMQDLSKHLSLEKNVQFRVNISYEDLKREMQESIIGLHTMWNEHFGIGVVECMAAGLIVVAHRSGGPQMDIVVEVERCRSGFLASDESEYAEAIAAILRMPSCARRTIRIAARSSVDRFSEQEFTNNFLRSMDPFFKSTSVS